MRLRIPHPVQTWFTSISGTSKRNPLLHRSDQTTADVSAPVQSNPAVLEAIQDLCYEIFAIPVATTEAVHIAQAVCGHIYEFSQSSQPPLQQLAMEMLPTLVHVYLVMLANSGREEFALGVSKTRRPPDADSKPLHRSRAQETPLDESLTSSKVRKSFRSRVSNLASKQSSNLLRGHQIMRQRTRKMFAGLSPQPVFRHKQQQQQQKQPAGQVQQSPAVTTTTAEAAAEVVPASTVSLLGGLPAFAANLAALSAILEACLLSLYNAYALRQPAVPQSRSADGIPAALFGGSIFSAAIPTPAAVTAINMLSPRVRTDLTSGSILLPTPTERLVVQSSSIGSSSSSPLPPRLPSLADCQPSIVSSISSRGEQGEQGIHLTRPRLPREKQITASNRMRILCLLCRNYVDHVFTSSTLSREAFCQLALLLGPRGMQHSLPPRLLTANFRKHRRKKGWNKICRKRFENIRTVDVSGLASTDAVAVATSVQLAASIPSAALQSPRRPKRLSSEEGGPLEGPETSTSISASSSSSSPSSAFSSNVSEDETGSNMSIYSNSSSNSVAADEKDGPLPDGTNANNNAGVHQTDSDGAADDGDEYLSSTADHDPSTVDEGHQLQAPTSPSFSSSPAVVSSAASSATSKDTPLALDSPRVPTGSKNGPASRDSLCRVTATTGAAMPPHGAVKRMEVSATAANSPLTSTGAEGKRQPKQRHRKARRRQRHASDPTRSASSVPPVSRIARLSSDFVLELLPGLDYLLDTELAPRSVEAIRALESRATFELWPDILLYINGITNGQPFRTAVVASQQLSTNTNQSHSSARDNTSEHSGSHRAITATSRAGGARHRHQHHLPPVISESCKTALPGDDRTLSSPVVPALGTVSKPSPHIITNAGFQALRTAEDIPLVESPFSTETERSLADTTSARPPIDTIFSTYSKDMLVSPSVSGRDFRLSGFSSPQGYPRRRANSLDQIFKGLRKHKGRPVTFANPPCEIPNQPESPPHNFTPRLDCHPRPSSCIRIDSRRRSL
nr:unnamed protein product [Spirometra erinaceieuropaei]